MEKIKYAFWLHFKNIVFAHVLDNGNFIYESGLNGLPEKTLWQKGGFTFQSWYSVDQFMKFISSVPKKELNQLNDYLRSKKFYEHQEIGDFIETEKDFENNVETEKSWGDLENIVEDMQDVFNELICILNYFIENKSDEDNW